MANKVVVGAMAAGIAGYALTEKVREMEVNRERARREQEHRDRQEESKRRLEEKLRKEGYRSMRAEMDSIANDRMVQREFQKRFESYLEEMLFGLTEKIGEGEGATRFNRNLQTLNLPLMSNECDKEDLMLAAALALGDSNVVDRVIESFSKQRLGIGLKKFSERSVQNIISVFQSLQDPNIDHTSLSIFITFAFRYSGLREEKPGLFIPKDAPPYSNNLCKWGEKFGIFVSEKSWMQLSSKMPQKSLGKSFHVKFDFDERRYYREDESGGLMLSNFRCAFEVPCSRDLSLNFEAVRLLQKRRPKRCTPDLDAIAHVFASKIAAGMANEAAKRLSQLVKQRRDCEEGISLEHISICAGKGSDLLKNLSEADTNMISGHKEMIESTLNNTLLKSVPPPCETDLEEGESPQEKLSAEVSAFVGAYIELVDLSYCEVPLLSGKPPSEYVPTYSVFGEVTQQKDCIFVGDPIMTLSVRRIQTKDERERLARSRHLVAPGTSYSIMFVLFTWGIMFWICVLATNTGLYILGIYVPNMMYTIFLCIFYLAFTQLTLDSAYRMLGVIFNIPSHSFHWAYYLKVASYCTEFIQRLTAAKLGKPTPYDQQMSKLREQCGLVYRAWKMRIARRDFQAALKRKRITNRESVLLLTEMADSYYQTEEEEVVSGVFHADLNEVEEFLKLKVEEGSSSTEVTLSPDDTIKNYLDLTSTATDMERSPLARLCDLSSTIEECVLFSEGDRVVVKFHDESEEEDTRSGNLTASVVFTTASRVYVHFDGEPAETPVPVPTHLCSILVENLPLIEGAQTPLLMDTCAEDIALSTKSDESENGSVIIESEEEIEETPKVPGLKQRVGTVEEALIDGGWVLTRAKKHIKYSRRVKLTKDGPSQKQTVTLSKTASDWRAGRNALSLLRRLNDNGEVIDESSVSVSREVATCRECKEEKPESSFSKTQWRKGPHHKKCKDCLNRVE